MNTEEAILNRRTIHSFEKTKVSEKLILKGIEAANHAPCHKLTFPWRYYSIGTKKRNQILELAIDLKSQENVLGEKSKAIIKEKFINPSHLLVATQILAKDDFTKKEDYAACSCSIQNMAILFSSFGINIKWSTGSITSNLKTYEIIDINPSFEEIIGFIWVGYGKKPLEINRPIISEVYKQI
tara:strand:- start:422 stop:970 length:549 start_codon:yes stop_codon:yes gene_type:complete